MVEPSEAVCDSLPRQGESERLAALGGVMREVIHEVKNRLFAIHSGLQLLRMDLPADPEMEETLKILFEESDRLDTFLKQLRLLCPSIRPKIALLDPAEIIERAGLPVSNTGATPPVLEREAENGLPQIRAEREMVNTALHHLLQNAVDASPPGGGILLSAAHDVRKDLLRLRVSDEGPGIPEEHRERIFDPFFSTKGGRTGIGLTVARKIMEDHGGSIQVESGVNGGTSASLLFPVNGAGRER